MELPVLHTERLLLRLPEQEDVPAIIDFYRENREFFAPYEPVRPDAFYTDAYWQQVVRESSLAFQADKGVRFYLFRNEQPGVIIDMANVANVIRGAFQACTLGYCIAEAEQGKGYMTEGLRAAIDYMFTEQGLHRIMANYMPRNRKSAAVLARLGFVVEGVAQRYLHINGVWEDHVLTSLMNRQWMEK